MNRLAAWLTKYVERARDPKIRQHRQAVLSGLGVKADELKNYQTNRGICILMQSNRHGETRTHGTIPDEDLDIAPLTPWDEWVKYRPIHDERMKRYIKAVAEELEKDKADVFAIYSGRKGMREVSNIQLVTARIKKIADENAKWGRFLK
jgi:hypothetical protein